jgi:hypothetical protein
MRKGSAGSSRGIIRFVDELFAAVRRAGATGPITIRADSGFWSWKLIERLNRHGIGWSITVSNHAAIRAAISAIPDTAWQDIDYTIGGHAQVAETTYVTGGYHSKRPARTARLIVRRTRLADPAQAQLWPEWRHHAFITSDTEVSAVEADQFHREHAVVELAIRDLKEGAGLDHIPSGHYGANAAWLACAVMAHNLGIWTSIIGGTAPATNRTRRVRLISLAGVIVNRSGRILLRLPTHWPWANEFHAALSALRALPAPSG